MNTVSWPGPVVTPGLCRAIAQTIVTARALEPSHLAHRFRGSYGFSIRCTRPGLAEVEQAYPSFRPFVEALRHSPGANAFFINPLVVAPGVAIGSHVDTSLTETCGQRVHPREVFVLYVQIPQAMRGGELVLRSTGRVLDRITPRAGHSLWFAGDLVHTVTRMRGRGDRISLVGEVYQLSAELLAKVPTYRLDGG